MVVAANFAFAQLKRRDEEVVMSVPPGLEFNKPYSIDEIKDAFEKDNPSEELKQRVNENQAKLKIKLEKKDLVVDDLEENIEETLEEEVWLPEEKEFHEGKQMAKGLDTMLQIMEEEEKEKDNKIRRYTNTEPAVNENPSAHELYHGEENDTKARSDNDKRRIRKVKKVRKPVKRDRRRPPQYGSGHKTPK